MKTYEMITLEQASALSLSILVQNYNEAIETIWHLQNKIQKLILENEQLCEACDSLIDDIYG